MVLEGIFVEILNTFLGDYIENLDKEQLSVAVLSGNIELRGLQFKESLLDDLNYPIRTAFGYLGKLSLVIPWTNLYTQPITLTIEDAVLLAVPNDEAFYNKEKGEQRRWEQKQRQLKHLELVGGPESDSVEAKKEPVEVKTTFKDKLLARLVNNLQVEIKNVHVRYEGNATEGQERFCFGATLGSALFKSTDEKFNIKTVDEVCHLVYKLLRLEYLSAYCSAKESKLFSGLPKEEILTEFQIFFDASKEDSSPIAAFHVLDPLFFTTRIALNPKPESKECEFSSPKLTLDMGLDAISLKLSRTQYAGILECLESLEGLSSKSKYRGFSIPEKPIGKQNARKWWEYAQQAVLEIDVRPRLRQWSWKHIKAHRDLLKQYSYLYSHKINSEALSAAEEKELEDLEKQMDVFNIVLGRHQAQYEVNSERKKPTWWSWLTGKSDETSDESGDEKDIRVRLKKALNEGERQKLHAALGISEAGDGTETEGFSASYISTRLIWDVEEASVLLVDDEMEKRSPVASLSLKAVSGRFEQRPSADGLFLKMEVKDVLVLGKERDEVAPVIARPDEGSPAWLQLLYESNPVETDAGVRLHLFVDPVQLVYDAETVNAIVKFFKPPESVALRQLQAQALMALQALRDASLAKVRDILENHRYTEFNVDFKAPYFVIREYGVESDKASTLVLDFGRVQLGSIARGGDVNPDIASLEELKEQSYEKYQLDFKDLQIIFAEESDDWQAARREQNSPIKILQPISCQLLVENCLIRNHPKLPLGKISGVLPSVTIDITEKRLLNLLKLLLTIPLPETSYTGDMEFSEKARDIVREYRDMKQVQTLFAMKQPVDELSGHDVVVLEFLLQIHEISIAILNKTTGRDPILKIAAKDLEQSVSLTASEMITITALDDIFIEFCANGSTEPPKRLIKAYRGNNQTDEKVLQLKYTSVSSLSPDFESKHSCTLSRLDAEFSGLEVTVDQKALIDISEFVGALREQVVAVVNSSQADGPRLLSGYFTAAPKDPKDVEEAAAEKVSTDLTATAAEEGFVSDDKLVHFALKAVGEMVTVTLADSRGILCRSVIEGLDVGFLTKKSSMVVEAKLKNISLENPDPNAIYPMILQTKGEDLLACKAIIHQEPVEIQRERELFSQEIEATLGGVEFVYLNTFFMEISRFAGELQGIIEKFSGVAEAATAKTKQAAIDIYESASRLRLELNLKAPVVILPQNSKSTNALIFDLGSLQIANELQDSEEALIDHMTISISSIAFDRVERYNAKDGPGANFSIFKQPDPTKILIKRNLSWKTDQSQPEIEAEGNLPSLEFALSNVDYQVILDTFTQNFAEGVVEQSESSAAFQTPIKSLPSVKEEKEPDPEPMSDLIDSSAARSPLAERTLSDSEQTDAEARSPNTSREFATPEPQADLDIFVDANTEFADESGNKVPRFKVMFTLDSLNASLYWVNRPRSRNRPPSDNAADNIEKLTFFKLNGFHIDAAVMQNWIISGGLIVKDLNLEDCRGAADRRINRLLCLKDNSESAEPLLNVEAKVEESGNQHFSIKVAQIEVAVIVDFFVEVGEFFTAKPPPAKKGDKSGQVAEVQKSPSQTPLKEKVKAVPTSPSKPAVTLPRTTTLNVVVNHPTIVLIEDPRNLDSKVLLLSTNLSLALGIVESGTSFQASAENVRMFATRYKTRAANPQQIITPFDLALQFKEPADAGQHVGITCTDLIITITPAVIKLITTTLAGLGNLKMVEEAPEYPVGVYENLWQPQPIAEDHWFLQPPEENPSDDKILTALEKAKTQTPEKLYQGDMFMFDIPSILIIVEVGEVNRFVPAFLLECRAFGTVRDWTTRLQAKGIIFLEMGYYNPKHDIWEPVIEPIDDGRTEHPWEVSVEVIRNDINVTELRHAARQGLHLQRRGSSASVDASSDSSDGVPGAITSEVMQESAALQVNIKATEPLQLTVSRTAVDLAKRVVDSFIEAANVDLPLQESVSSAPYIVMNHLGIDVRLQVLAPLQYGLDENVTADSDGMIQVKSGASREIYLNKTINKFRKNALHQSAVETDIKLRLLVAGRTIELSLLKAERRFFFIQNTEDIQRPYRLIIDIIAETSYKAIHLQSSMVITNYLLMPVELQGGFASVDHIGVIDPSQTIFMPIKAVQFDEKAVLTCRPAHSELYLSSQKIPIGEILRMDAEEKVYTLECESTKLAVEPTLFFNLFCRVIHVKYENTAKLTPNSLEYQVFLRSVVTIANVLPYDIAVGYSSVRETRLSAEEKLDADPHSTDNHIAIEAGNSCPLYTVHPEKHRLLFRLKGYMDNDWDGDVILGSLKEEFTPCVLACRGAAPLSEDSDKQDTILLGIRTLIEDGTMFLTLYSPFWMLNKTGLALSYKNPTRKHLAAVTQPLLYSTSYANLQEKRKISIQVEESEWSKKFSPDAVGSNGVITCKRKDGDNERTFEIGMQIKSSASVVTKLVVFTPYYVLSNLSDKVAIDVCENHDGALWFTMEPKSTMPFWPMYRELKDKKDKKEDDDGCPASNRLVCRISGTSQVSAPFCYGILQSNLLQVHNKFGGIYVETQVSESNAVTTFQPFFPSRPTSKLINLTSVAVWHKQLADILFVPLAPRSEKLFAWTLPAEEKKLEWYFQEQNVLVTDFDKDDAGTVPLEGYLLYWVSFFQESQRIVLFTDDVDLALRVQQSVDLEPTALELVASVQSIGLSLVNNIGKHEVLYAGIVSGDPSWQWRKLHGNSKRFHSFKGADAHQLECAFQKYKSNVEADIHIEGIVKIDHSSMEVDFGQMLMTKPHNRQLQRIYEDGFWCRLKTSVSQYNVHLKLEKVQIDNPNPLSQYPTLFIPVPIPESVGHKPMIEASLIIYQSARSKVPQYKLLEALVQEVEIRADQGVINAIVAILQPEEENGFIARQKMLENFRKQDGEELKRSLSDTVVSTVGTDNPVWFDHLVIHPLKLHISFSMTGAENDTQSAMSMSSEFMALFMRTLGVTATEINDVLIKLATFERMHKSFTQEQMLHQFQSHYVSQLLKQFYTIALGLDILGNPFGLIRGITGGVRDLFYEPYEGAIEGPEEFMSGLGCGIQSLVGKSVGGVLGTAEKLTGSVGRAIASVSFDEKFIRNRQREKNRTPTDLPGALAQSGKALGMGVAHGITGVVTKPVEGARQEGVAGFFKGIGRGLIGVVVRPTAGVVDFATGSLEAVRRLATSEVDSVRLRPTRHISPDGVVRPYNLHQSEGAYIFRDIQSKELKEDEYVTHLVTSRERRHVLVLTTKRIIYLERGEILHGRFSILWNYEWDHFMGPPTMSEKGIMFPVFEAQEKGLKGLLHLERKDKPRYVFVEDIDSGEWFIRKVKGVMESMIEK